MIEYQPEKFHRLILKISGEFLAGERGYGFDPNIIDQLTDDIKELKKLGYTIGIIVGGGNICRGKDFIGIDRVAADNVGMLATVQNAIVISEDLKKKNYQTEIYSAFPIDKVAKYYNYADADKALKQGVICFLSGGTGNPFFTTDTAAILRAIELKCDLVLKGTKVDGIYTSDPKIDKDAEFISEITYSEVLIRHLNIMDMTAFSLARDNNIPLKVFNITKKGNMVDAVLSKSTGTYVSEHL